MGSPNDKKVDDSRGGIQLIKLVKLVSKGGVPGTHDAFVGVDIMSENCL